MLNHFDQIGKGGSTACVSIPCHICCVPRLQLGATHSMLGKAGSDLYRGIGAVTSAFCIRYLAGIEIIF